MLLVHLFVCFVRVILLSFFSSSWCRSLALKKKARFLRSRIKIKGKGVRSLMAVGAMGC